MTQLGHRPICKVPAMLALSLCMTAAAAQAEGKVQVPDGCTAVATVHKNSCITTTVLQCAGSTWQALTYRRGKPYDTTQYDRDWGFVTWRSEAGNSLTMNRVPGSGASMNIRDMLDIGYHDAAAEFIVTTNIIEGQPYTLSGRTQATGRTVTVDGEAFIEFKAHRLFERAPGEGGLVFDVDVLVSLARELVIEGNWSRRVMDSEADVFDHAPRRIADRGEPGFLETMSEFGCG